MGWENRTAPLPHTKVKFYPFLTPPDRGRPCSGSPSALTHPTPRSTSGPGAPVSRESPEEGTPAPSGLGEPQKGTHALPILAMFLCQVHWRETPVPGAVMVTLGAHRAGKSLSLLLSQTLISVALGPAACRLFLSEPAPKLAVRVRSPNTDP